MSKIVLSKEEIVIAKKMLKKIRLWRRKKFWFSDLIELAFDCGSHSMINSLRLAAHIFDEPFCKKRFRGVRRR